MAQGAALLEGRNTIASIDISERKFWLRTTNETSITHQKSLAVSNLATTLSTTSKKLSSKTRRRRLGHLGLGNLRKLKSYATGIALTTYSRDIRTAFWQIPLVNHAKATHPA
jgi:hypothetical protein